MERLKVFLKKAFSYPELLYKTHPLSTVMMIAATVFFSVYTFIGIRKDFDGVKMNVFLCICLSFLFFAVFSLGIESIRLRDRRIKAVVLSVFAVISLFCGFLVTEISTRSSFWLVNLQNDLRKKIGISSIILDVFAIMVLFILVAVYFSYNHGIKQEFNSHILRSQSKIFFSSIIYGVIQFGVLMLTIIVMELLYSDAMEYLPAIIILINGLFYVPAVAYALTHENEEANIFFQVIIRYVSLVITIIAYVIIYIYMIKLVVTTSVPSNSVYAILTALFLMSMYITYMCTPFENKGLLQKFAYNCPLIFAPFILMQCYTIFVRIGQYGLTPKRYFGIAFILFEVIYVIFYTMSYRKDKEIIGSHLLLIIGAFIVITVFVPGISAKSLSTGLAKRTLSEYMQKAAANTPIDDRLYIRANAAYGFLSDRDYGEGKLEKYFAGMDKDTVKAMKDGATEASGRAKKTGTPETARDRYCWYNSSLSQVEDNDYIDLSGFDRMTRISIIQGDDDPSHEMRRNVDLSDLEVDHFDAFTDEARKPVAEYPRIDLTQYVNSLVSLYGQYDDNMISSEEYDRSASKLSRIDVNENIRLYIVSADVTLKGDDVVFVNIDGYMLIKE